MRLEDLWVARHLDSRFFNPGAELLAEGLELLARFPDLADSEVALIAKQNMKLTAARR
jgi:hypothetical protein